MKERNLSIELVKFFAVLFVANHWMTPLFTKWSALSTGGAIGDVLFFFASGYTLFLGRFGRFDNWYKRRIRRIYPSILAFMIILSFLDIAQKTAKQLVLGGGYWFIMCIMIYYVILYFVRKFAERKPLIPFLLETMAVIVWYLTEDSSRLFMYGATYFKWCHYFLFMLLGAYMGNKTIEVKSSPIRDGFILVASLICFYGIQILAKHSIIAAHLQLLTLVPLMGVVLSIFKLCCAAEVVRMMYTKLGLCLRFVAGLCLEVYIVAHIVIEFMVGKLDSIFPMNLLVTFALIVTTAYLTRCLARIILQIFEREDMDWRKVMEPVVRTS